MEQNRKKTIIIGCGIAGPTLAMALQKCGIESTIYESQESPSDNRGLFLHLGPNGVNILKTLGIEKIVRENGHPCNNYVFEKHNGAIITRISTKDDEEKYGTRGIIIKRGIMQKIMREQIESRGIKIEWGKQLKNITVNDDADTAIAHFEDDSSVSSYCVIGCDGLHSRTRKIMMPDAPMPKYSGHVAAGGFAQNQTKQPQNELSFHFGKKAYMIYFVTKDKEAMWGAHLSIDESLLHKIKSVSHQQWRQQVSDLYDKDASHIGEFTKTDGNFTRIPLYDIESLPKWYNGLVCLVGDSAHATTPHIGQGASIAMESSLVLAKCLRDIPDIQNAFATYQKLRKPRVEKMIVLARRSGRMFTSTNPIGKLIRNIMIPIMMKRNPEQFDDIYGYKIDWDEKIK
ncbi:MAG: FAD-dependent oxidoreductase [Nitrosopumilus sp.]